MFINGYSVTKQVFPYSFAWVEFTQQVVLSMWQMAFFLKLKFQCNVINFDFGYVMVHGQKNLTSYELGQQHLVSD